MVIPIGVSTAAPRCQKVACATILGKDVWLPLDHQYYRHEAEAVRIMDELRALGWVFWE